MTPNDLHKRKRIRMFPTIEDWAIDILKEAGRPMHYREITDKILDNRPISSTTPYKSVYAVLLRSNQIKALGEGYFDLDK